LASLQSLLVGREDQLTNDDDGNNEEEVEQYERDESRFFSSLSLFIFVFKASQST